MWGTSGRYLHNSLHGSPVYITFTLFTKQHTCLTLCKKAQRSSPTDFSFEATPQAMTFCCLLFLYVSCSLPALLIQFPSVTIHIHMCIHSMHAPGQCTHAGVASNLAACSEVSLRGACLSLCVSALVCSICSSSATWPWLYICDIA